MSKYPKCECNTKKFSYFRKRYRNNTLHLMRKCPGCGKVAQNPMRQNEYDQTWVDGLPVMENGDLMKPTVRSRADTIMAKLHNHIENRKQTDDNRQQHPFRTDR